MAPSGFRKPHPFKLPPYLVPSILFGAIALIIIGFCISSVHRRIKKTGPAERSSIASYNENSSGADHRETPGQRDLRLAVDREIAGVRASARYPPNEPLAAPRLQGQAAPRLSSELYDIDLGDSGSSTTPNAPPKAMVRAESFAAVPSAEKNWPLRNSTGSSKTAGSKHMTPMDRLKVKLNGGSRN